MTMTPQDLTMIRATAARWDADRGNQPEHCTTCGVELSAVEQYAGDIGCPEHRFTYTPRPRRVTQRQIMRGGAR